MPTSQSLFWFQLAMIIFWSYRLGHEAGRRAERKRLLGVVNNALDKMPGRLYLRLFHPFKKRDAHKTK